MVVLIDHLVGHGGIDRAEVTAVPEREDGKDGPWRIVSPRAD